MEFIQGENRNQINLLPSSIDEYIDEDNPTRVIDAYVESLDLQALGFEKAAPNETGRPMYSPKDMLKLYVYGYMNRVRSSRRLEAETKRNLEVIWLMNNLIPDHKTIARFRQNNPKALKNVFRDFVALCNKLDLFGKELIAIDGSKFKAWNTKDRNFTKDKLQDRLKRIDDKIAEYLNILNDNDALNCCQLKYIISKCRFMVVARTHASIAAYSSSVPTLVIGYSVKSRGIAKDLFGTEEHYVLPVEKIRGGQDLKDEFMWIAGHEQEIRAHYEKIMAPYIARAAEAGRYLQEI